MKPPKAPFPGGEWVAVEPFSEAENAIIEQIVVEAIGRSCRIARTRLRELGVADARIDRWMPQLERVARKCCDHEITKYRKRFIH